MQVLEIAENGYSLSISRGHIVISEKGLEKIQVPVDSISAIILSAEGIILTKAFLARMGEENTPIIICGDNYMPIAMQNPIANHSRMLPIVEKQIAASQVIKKQLWKEIIKNKIYNQYSTLKFLKPNSLALPKLLNLYEKVRSGDSDNKEAQAARIYFPALFGKDFIRDTEQFGINTFLNYSYAVIRATFARAICASGLLPMLGIKHHNVYNAFCLVDDLMEVARPLADFYVYNIFTDKDEIAFDPQRKRELLRLLANPIIITEQEHFLATASLKYVQAFSHSLSENKVILPNFDIILK